MTQTISPSAAEVHYDPDCDPERVAQVLSALNRWSGRTAQHVTHKRANDRHEYHGTVIIEPSQVQGPPSGVGIRRLFHVPTRNVSQAGLGFVAPPVFMPRLMSDETPLVRSELMFRVGTQIKVNLASAAGAMLTLSAVVARLRPVHFGFFDIGVRFLGREEASECAG